LAILTNGTLWAWGGGDQGQLGDGKNSDQVTPEPISDSLCGPETLTNAVALAAGYDFSLAVDATGVVWSWGDGGDTLPSGQLGNGANTNVLTPAPISGISDVVSVAAGNRHALALRADGTVWAWGNDIDYDDGSSQTGGVLGAGSVPSGSTNVPIRSQIAMGTNIVAIAAGNFFSLALDRTGQIWAWGDNYSGQIRADVPVCRSGAEVGTCTTNVPVLVPGISNVIAIAAGYQHSIAVTADKTLWTWGLNGNGELGRTDTNGGWDPLPAQVPGLSNVVAIAGGYDYSLVVTSNGQVFAFGNDGQGQLGNPRGRVQQQPNTRDEYQ